MAGITHAQQKLVIYTSNASTLNEFASAAFSRETGIKVELISAGSGVVIKRLQAEKDRPQGDIVWGISRSLLETNKAIFAPYASKNIDAILAEYRDPNNRWIGNNLHLLVILQNTKAVPANEGPKTWEDVLNPKYKGKIAFTDPANSASAYRTVTVLVDHWGGGEAGWKNVKALFANMKVLNRSSLVFQGVGNGEYPLGISLEYAGYVWSNNGAPVKNNVDERSHARVFADNVRCGRLLGALVSLRWLLSWRCGSSGERRPSAAIGAAREVVSNTQAAWNSPSRRAGERGGARVGKPRWARIRTITRGSTMAAMRFTAPPQFRAMVDIHIEDPLQKARPIHVRNAKRARVGHDRRGD